MRQIVISVFIFFCLIIQAETISDVILSQNPVAYWKFDETTGTTAIDSSGHGYNGTYVGTVSLGTEGISDNSTAFSINGGGYMSVSVPITASFSIMVWGKSATTYWNDYGWLASSREPNGFIIHPNPSTKSVGMYLINSSSGSAHTGFGGVTPEDITEWHQYGITYDATTHLASAILDGQIVATETYTGNRVNDTLTIWFGRDQYISRYGRGSIDEAALFSRSLTSEEIWAQYQSSLNTPEPQTYISLVLGLVFALKIFKQKQ